MANQNPNILIIWGDDIGISNWSCEVSMYRKRVRGCHGLVPWRFTITAPKRLK
jgi:hypothetical protein